MKKIVKYIEDEIYYFNFYLIANCNLEQYHKEVAKIEGCKINWSNEPENTKNADGSREYFEDGGVYIWIKDIKKDYVYLHEILHHALYVAKLLPMKDILNDQEQFIYYYCYLIDKIKKYVSKISTSKRKNTRKSSSR